MSAARRFGAICLVAIAVLIMGAAIARPQGVDDGLVPVGLQVGFTRSSFLGVNEADARAAFKVFSAKVGERRGYEITPTIRVFNDLTELMKEIELGTQDLLILESWDYLTLSPIGKMPVEFVTVEQGVMMEDYLVLVRADTDYSNLGDLEGRHVIVLDSTNSNIGKHWLRTELMALGVLDPRAFFNRFEIREKPSQVVLPVFFGNADACVVDRSGFEIMAELNPQVGKMLRVMTRSDAYLDTVACVRLNGWEDPKHRTDLIAALQELTQDPAGQQIMSLFRFNELIKFENEFLDTVRVLHRRHDTFAEELDSTADGTEGQ